MTAHTVEDAAQLFVNPSSYTDETALEAAFALLREKAPVVRVEHPNYRPFWALTKYADIVEVLRNHELWLNEPRSVLQTRELDDALDVMRDAGAGLHKVHTCQDVLAYRQPRYGDPWCFDRRGRIRLSELSFGESGW